MQEYVFKVQAAAKTDDDDSMVTVSKVVVDMAKHVSIEHQEQHLVVQMPFSAGKGFPKALPAGQLRLKVSGHMVKVRSTASACTVPEGARLAWGLASSCSCFSGSCWHRVSCLMPPRMGMRAKPLIGSVQLVVKGAVQHLQITARCMGLPGKAGRLDSCRFWLSLCDSAFHYRLSVFDQGQAATGLMSGSCVSVRWAPTVRLKDHCKPVLGNSTGASGRVST